MEKSKYFSDKYYDLWNSDVQAQIDADIEKNRKASGSWQLENIAPGSGVKAEQISHDFVFGAHIFNFDQLGDDEANAKYKELYGTLFNSATIAFYWKQLELEEGKPRFAAEYRDSAEFWNNCSNPKEQPHWRRPATDPVVDFCVKKGIRLHCHPLVWGNYRWMIPDWLISQIPLDELSKFNFTRGEKSGILVSDAAKECHGGMTANEWADKYPEYTAKINTLMAKRIMEIALRYGDRIDSYDVVNESATDFGLGVQVPGERYCKSWYGPMPGDYTYRAFKIAESVIPGFAKLNINDYNMSDAYLNQTVDLLKRGCKIDIMGAQMHLFDPQVCLDIADGTSDRESPAKVYEKFNRLGKAGLPIHLSEITITAPNNDARGQEIQAVITRNLYRLWFSLAPMMGITWWNVVDDCGAPGEPAVSGLYSKKMAPNPAAEVLQDLINNQWKTRLELAADGEGKVSFRGFKGKYRLSWCDRNGNAVEKIVHLQ